MSEPKDYDHLMRAGLINRLIKLEQMLEDNRSRNFESMVREQNGDIGFYKARAEEAVSQLKVLLLFSDVEKARVLGYMVLCDVLSMQGCTDMVEIFKAIEKKCGK